MVVDPPNAPCVSFPCLTFPVLIFLGRALLFRTEIDRFVGQPQNRDTLWRYELSNQDWNAIELVTGWLRLFCDATIEMLTTKRSTLSYVHCIFRTLQDYIKTELAKLPNSTPICIREGLSAAHHKLSDYYLKFDDSPYYIWASSTFYTPAHFVFINPESAALDPCIGYEAFRANYKNEPDLQVHIDESLEKLRQHYNRFYVPTLQPHPPREHLRAGTLQSPVKCDWLARYRSTQISLSELDNFLRLRQESFEGCDSIKWWAARRQQFLNLSHLARDIFSIPG